MKAAWRELAHLVKAQLWFAAIGSVMILFLHQKLSALAFLAGALLISTGVMFSARFGLRAVNSPFASMAAVFASIGWRWLWILTGLYLAVGRWQLPVIWVIAGIVVTQLASIIAGMRFDTGNKPIK